jgi:hypothetical protein
MAKRTIFFGAALVLVGLAGYFLTGRQSVTALIPAFVGLPILILGGVGLQPAREKVACLIAAILTLLGLGGCAPGLIKLVSLLRGIEVARPAAVYLQSLMAILSLIYLAIYIRTVMSRNRDS